MRHLKRGDIVEDLAPLVAPAKAKSPEALRRWCAVTTERHAEDGAELRIADLGYLVYVPRYTVRVRDRGKHRVEHDVRRPLFAGYLFARLSPLGDPWGDIERLRGVRELVKASGQPITAPDALIDELIGREPANFGQPYRRRDVVLTDLKIGNLGRATDGPFAGFVGQVAAVDDKGRITLLLEIFGRLSKITNFEPDQVEPASAPRLGGA